MERKRGLMLGIAGIGVLALSLAAASPSDAVAAAGHETTVDNTTANPVPVSVVGTASVNVGSLPAVTFAGTPSFSLSGTPSVRVGNPSTNPVLVRNVDEPARELFQQQLDGIIDSGSFNGCAGVFTVPAGKRMVIEHLTMNAFAPTDQQVLFTLNITNGDNGEFVEHTINARRSESGSSVYVASDSLKAMGSPGSDFCVALRRLGSSATGLITVSASISGYFIDG